jgi:acetyl-CoA carboxylase carboxyltransferase component
MKKVIASVVDDGDYIEVHPHWAMNLTCGFARIDGRVVGIVGNQPSVLAGVLDIDSSEKAPASCAPATPSTSRSSPSSTCPGSCPAPTRSTAASSATAPSCSTPTARRRCRGSQVITRKAYGGAYVVMNSKSIGADLAYAWPSAELAVMGPRAPSRSSTGASWPRPPTPPRGASRAVEEYTERYANPYIAAERGYVDDVIDPADTRRILVREPRHAWPPSARTCPSASTGTCSVSVRR